MPLLQRDRPYDRRDHNPGKPVRMVQWGRCYLLDIHHHDKTAALLRELQRAQKLYIGARLHKGEDAHGYLQGLADAWVEIQIISEKLVDTRDEAHRI